MPAELFPAFIKLDDRPCLVVGAGSIATSKIASLLRAGARLTVVAPQAKAEVATLAAAGNFVWHQREFQSADLKGVFLAIAATASNAVNRAVFRAAQKRGILCNAVDDPPHCDFYFPAIVRRGDLQIAISTAGESPSVAQRFRREIEASLDLSRQLAPVRRQSSSPRTCEPSALGRAEKTLATSRLQPDLRLKGLQNRIALDRIRRPPRPSPGKSAGARGRRPTIHPGATMNNATRGKVHLVGAGPGDPELLTVKAHALIRSAEIILHDDLVSAAILALAGPHAMLVNVGKRCGAKNITQSEINRLMIASARRGLQIVRLKSGDPGIFGRLAEERDALEAAGIPYEIVPGITAALAAAAELSVSLTDRRTSSRIVVISSHRAHENENEPATDWRGLATNNTTLVVYMPGQNFAALQKELLDAGLDAATPAAIVSRASTPDQREFRTTLGQLQHAPPMDAPSILLIGRPLEHAAQSIAASVPLTWESLLDASEVGIAANNSNANLDRRLSS